MNIRKLLPVFIAAIALAAAVSVHPANAAGLLYINPPQQGPFASGTTVTYQVKVANIDPFNGWDISVSTDPTAVNPSSFTITSNLLAANFSQTVLELIHCVNGSGSGCTLTDGPGVVHSSVVVLGPPPQTGPSSGVLFTITYTAGTGTFSSVHIFNDVISNGTPTPVAHTTQDGVYGNRPPTASFTATPTSGNSPVTVAFDGSASSDSDLFDRVVEWDWTFGDGTPVQVTTVPTTSHTYNPPATTTFTASLVVKDTHGASSIPATQMITVTVPLLQTTTTVACTPSTVNIGQPASCTVTVADSSSGATATPTGSVTFSLDPASTATGMFDSFMCTLTGYLNTASCSVNFTPLTTGTATVDASYGGDTSHSGSTGMSNILTVVSLHVATTSITCSPNTPFTNQPTSCTVTVIDTSNTPTTPTGSVSFSTNSTGTFSANTCSLVAGSAAGTATCSVSYTATVTGGHKISAAYSGDHLHAPSSGTAVITVSPAITTVNAVCSPSRAVISQQSTCSATVTDNTNSPTTPTGTVSFTSSSASGFFSPAGCALAESTKGTASCAVTYTSSVAGSQTVTGTYSGDPTHGASYGSTGLTVDLRSTTTAIACVPSTVIVNTASSCTVTVQDTSSAGIVTSPTGTVTFALRSDSTASGSFSASSCGLLAGSTAGTSSCSVSFTPSSAGAATMVATYDGDLNHSGSSGGASLTANQRTAATVKVTCSGPVTIGSSTTCTATVTGAVPTGGITFTSTSTTGKFSGSTCSLRNGECSVTYTDTTAGTVTITASYIGDASNIPGTGVFTLTVSSPTSTIFGLQPYIFYGIVGVIVAAISTIGGIVVGRARRKPPRQPPSAKSRSGD